MTRLKTRRYLIIVVAILLVAAIVIGGRGLWRLAFRLVGPPPPPRQTDVSTIAGWMPVRLVSRAYRVPEPEIFRVLGLEPRQQRGLTLDQLATETGRSSDEVVLAVREAVRQWQADHPEPSPPPKPGNGPRAPPDKPDSEQPAQ